MDKETIKELIRHDHELMLCMKLFMLELIRSKAVKRAHLKASLSETVEEMKRIGFEPLKDGPFEMIIKFLEKIPGDLPPTGSREAILKLVVDNK